MKSNSLALLVSLIAVTTAPSAHGQWVNWPVSSGGNGHSYLPVKTTSTISWTEANEAARNSGGYLATITSAQENAFVFALVNSPGFFSSSGLGPVLGGYQPPGSPEPGGGWTWVSGEPWQYSNWSGGSPDNGDSPSEDGLHFLGDGSWNDKRTNQQAFISYVVERDDDVCTPHRAKATAELVNGFVVGATITDGGCGYTNAPAVLVEGGGGSGAIARAEITDGRVIRIVMTDAGCCYTSPPRIVIASPPFVPSLTIAVSRVKVVQSVVLGRHYVLESSHDTRSWSEALPPFTATNESITNEFDVDVTGRFFRVRETQ